MTAMIVTREMVETPHFGSRMFEVCVDASEIGLAPGEWPETLQTTIGNGRPFILQSKDENETHTYKQELGTYVLKVFND